MSINNKKVKVVSQKFHSVAFSPKGKKADMNVSFSWIFMIIVGAFFLILTWNIIAKYQINKDMEYKIELKQALRNIFNDFGRTAGIEENSLAPIGNIFRDSRVEIICQDKIPILSINDDLDANNNYLQSYPTFMTYIEQGKVDQTYLAVESFRMPFKITNLLAIISKRNLIVIDEDSEFGKKLLKKIKLGSYSQLNYLYLSFGEDLSNFNHLYVEDKNLNSIVFVTDYDINLPDSNLINSLKVLNYVVKIEETTKKYGKIHYEVENEEISDYIYYDLDEDLSLQTMAVFSSPETFECSYSTLFNSMESVYNFYIDKADYYMNYNNNLCMETISPAEHKIIYEDVKNQLININQNIKNNKFINVENLNLNITVLEEQNLRLEENSCPYIY